MPAAFFGHGSPMNALEDNRYTRSWAAFGAAAPRPRAILVISAHWYIGATAITAMTSPRTIHDFYGFPQDLFDVEYPAPGDADLAGEIVEVVEPMWIGLDHDSWGIDHGSWSVLVHAFPAADIPVLQLAIDATKPAAHHVQLGTRLAALRQQGVLIVGSGNVVHNLRRLDPSRPEQAFDWARRFDEEARRVMTEAPGDVESLVAHQDFELCAPTPDHFIPLLYIAGVAAASDQPAEVLVDGYGLGSLSMISYGVD